MTRTADILAELEQLGTAQNRMIYRRHGIEGEQYGVSYAALDRLKKRIKVDHPLAQELWSSANHDARILATKIADPKQADDALLERWVSDLDNYVLTDALANYAGRTSCARQLMAAWIRADGEWIERSGWLILAHLAMNDSSLPDELLNGYLDGIERDVHAAKNRVRDAMNSALIAIGMRSDAWEKRALAVAERIGKIEIDHGETGCKTPDAIPYIRKARERARKKEKRVGPGTA